MNAQSLIAVTDTQAGDLAGVSTWFQLGGSCSAAALRSAGMAAGLMRDDMPGDTTPKTALRRAVADLTDKRMLARSLPGGGWALVSERDTIDATGIATLAHVVCMQVMLLPSGALIFDKVSDPQVEAQVRVNFATHLGRLEASDLSMWLVDTAKRIGAVPLRERGGVYFVPRHAVDEWRIVSRVLRAEAPACDVYELPTLRSDEAVRSIVAALTREAETTATEYLDKIASGELGERALRARGAECEALVNKLAAYESLLGTGLDSIKARIGDVAAAAQTAALLAASETDTVSNH